MSEQRPGAGSAVAAAAGLDGVLEGPAAPPAANGELVFEAPWQARLFGMAWSLCDAGLFEWDEFRAKLGPMSTLP